MQEDMLLNLLIKKPEKGLKAVMDKYPGLVYHIAYARLKNVCVKEDIEELAGDVFFSLYQNRNSISLEKGGIKAYLCTVTLRKSVDIYRQKRSHTPPFSLDDEILISGASADEIFMKEEAVRKLYEAISELPEKEREAVVRKVFLGQTSKEISEELSISDEAVRRRISRAYAALREMLKGVI